jgi:hypothetical protein
MVCSVRWNLSTRLLILTSIACGAIFRRVEEIEEVKDQPHHGRSDTDLAPMPDRLPAYLKANAKDGDLNKGCKRKRQDSFDSYARMSKFRRLQIVNKCLQFKCSETDCQEQFSSQEDRAAHRRTHISAVGANLSKRKRDREEVDIDLKALGRIEQSERLAARRKEFGLNSAIPRSRAGEQTSAPGYQMDYASSKSPAAYQQSFDRRSSHPSVHSEATLDP